MVLHVSLMYLLGLRRAQAIWGLGFRVISRGLGLGCRAV